MRYKQLKIMIGLNIKVTLIFNAMLAVQGNVYRKTKYTQNNLFERDQAADSIGYDYFGSAFKSEFEFSEPLRKLRQPWPVDRAERRARSEMFSEHESHIPTSQWQKCQNLKGLLTPESGCCGVELPRFPGHRNNLNDHRGWLRSEYDRIRRSAASDTPPAKLVKRGIAIEPQRLPWMVRVTIRPIETPQLHGPEECGGTIISSRFVVTAAHCLDDFKDLSQLEVFLAEYDTYSFPKDCINGGECFENKVMKVEKVIKHQYYNDTFLQNDIALLRLSSDIPYTQFIRPVCLPEADAEDFHDKTFIVGGWGLNGRQETNLKKAAFTKYVENDECKEQYSYKDDSMFCSIGSHGEDTCHGDSGGPLMVFVNNKYFLAGIVSGKRKDLECGSSVSSLYSNVFYHKDWLIKHVK